MALRTQRRNYQKITKNIEQSFKQNSLKKFKKQLLIDLTDNGLRIQIVDKAGRPMFLSGSSRLRPYAEKILNEIGLIINKANSKISITGHTDGKPYTDRIDYSNWELSADRANAARRAMLDGGLKWHLVSRIVGMGSSILLDRKKPVNPINRRISIVVLNAKALSTLKRLEKSQAKVLARWHSAQLPKDKKNTKPKHKDPKRSRSTILRRTQIPGGLKNRSLLNNYSPKSHKAGEKPLKSGNAIDKHKTPASNPSSHKKKDAKSKLPNNEVDTSVPEKYRGKPAVRAGPGTKISLPPIIDRAF